MSDGIVVLLCSKRYLMTAANKNGLDVTPKTTLVYRYVTTFSPLKGVSMSVIQKNLATSLSLARRLICRKAFSTSATSNFS